MLQKNDRIELTIEDVGIDGEGIGKYEGMTFFVKDAIIGDKILAHITKLKKNYAYARVEEILSPSSCRVQPECELYQRCGGCQIQAMDYREQLRYKQNKVKENLCRIGGFREELVERVMQPIVGMETPYRYRNKAQFPIGRDKNGQLAAGFYAARTHSMIPVCDCKLGVKENQVILQAVLSYMKENRVDPYDETAHKGLVRHVLIRYGFATKEIMVCLVINGKSLPHQDRLIDRLSAIEGVTGISVNQNKKNTNVILGNVTETIWGQPYITDYLRVRKCKSSGMQNETERKSADVEAERGTEQEFVPTDTAIAYHISPQSFYQVNPLQTEKLYCLVLDYADLTGTETVWDLYCGIGTISLFLAKQAGMVYGVEIVPQAIEDAENNAKLNGITNAHFFVGKVEETLPAFYEKAAREKENSGVCECKGDTSDECHEDASDGDSNMLHPDVIVVDPPRRGCDEKCLETMIKMRPERIVYVSCDSATLARDLRILCDGGYELKKVRAVDQFGQTVHVEVATLLQRKETCSK